VAFGVARGRLPSVDGDEELLASERGRLPGAEADPGELALERGGEDVLRSERIEGRRAERGAIEVADVAALGVRDAVGHSTSYARPPVALQDADNLARRLQLESPLSLLARLLRLPAGNDLFVRLVLAP
jgi:hypothetical protein